MNLMLSSNSGSMKVNGGIAPFVSLSESFNPEFMVEDN